MWRGSVLADTADEVFVRAEAVRLNEIRITALEQRVAADLELGHHAELVEELQELVARHPYRERFWEQLMLTLYRCGRQAEALRVFQTARAWLAEELGIDPGPALLHLEEQILTHDPALSLSGAPDPGTIPNNLPLQRTSFIGRKKELELGRELLAKSRLITLIGPPGSGKTRTAIRLAADHTAGFPHGSFFIPLAAVTDVGLIAGAISQTLGLREVPGETPLEGLKAHLHDRRALLLLDNFEQIIEGAPLIGELLDAAPDIKIMVTSRSRLGISGEQEFPIPPLTVPPAHPLPDLETLSTYDAIALFLARARASDPSFDLDAANAAAVAEIAMRLDGLPLAIELAAARIRLLGPQDLADRLGGGLAVLTGAPADAVGRHRTLRQAITWSYDLLPLDEQILFRRLGIFHGFTLEAATNVADLSETEVLDGMDSLLSKSLLHRLVGFGKARFAMLETLRE
jgi:predicted ATPase